MTDSKADAAAAYEATSAAAPSAPPTTAPADPPPASPLQAEPQVDVAALAKEAADNKDRLLRTLAEMENLRRRTEREVADARAYGISGFGRDMLGVADNLRRALAAVAPESRADLPAPIVAFIDGVELTERELLKAFERNGVKRFDPVGEKFDPNVHQAMFEIPDPTAPTGTVVQVLQSGFMIGDRVLRPAMVGVAKGGPKAAPAAPASTGTESSGTAGAGPGAS
ncbi:MAG: nucleotide exchange factor GrpE [Rhodoplanes sp.]|uniref:nucleotide exchange factor GrpE n=1 Tax=Rhodoplanes sp. TaxID=1968906 RepID=UPI00183585FB|nr:nucleotide exchange factor GrpE [Rhodoplanes sp.]NVO14318.1 nucleotide exchange factor GrpE [Rhodoplanes sp.]